MRNALPAHGKLSKEAKETVQECVSEFISFVTSQAAEKCSIEKRKTLNGEDILFAMYTLGLENYSETLKIYLAKYRKYEQDELESKKNDNNRPKRPYHRKNPKNRPKNSNRFVSSGSPDELLLKNNLPTLVPTTLLSLPNDNDILQPVNTNQILKPVLPQVFHQGGNLQQNMYNTNQEYKMEEMPTSIYPTANSNFYTYSNQIVTEESSKPISSEEELETSEGDSVYGRFSKSDSQNGHQRTNTIGGTPSTGNVINYGDFMNL